MSHFSAAPSVFKSGAVSPTCSRWPDLVHTFVEFSSTVCVFSHPVTLGVRVTLIELVTDAARGDLLTPSPGRGASFFPGYRKQTS